MVREVYLADVALGSGRAKIIVAVASAEDVRLALESECDIVEVRADLAPTEWEKLLQAVRGRRPILATVRSESEGGKCPDALYEETVTRLLAQSPEAIDVQVDHPAAATLVQRAHEVGCKVVGSFHDFAATPSVEKICEKFADASELGADVCKVALMPHGGKDVLTVLEALRLTAAEINRPLIGIAMGKVGQLSRLAGLDFGNCATFAAAGNASAPGQLRVDQLRQIICD
ncbi:type I 3-dehydroquinate dehydratase [Winkia sp. UMB1185]|nr:type I 3-dehydroquinate dehydratase [Winkia sp. UMB1185]